MTGNEIDKCIREGKSFYVFGEVMIYDSSKGDAVSPHALYRECLATDKIAIRIMTKEEYEKWHLIVAGSVLFATIAGGM